MSEGRRRAASCRVPADPNVRERGGRSSNRHAKCEEGWWKGCDDVSKSPTVPAVHKGYSAITESCAIGYSYFNDRPRPKTTVDG